LTCPLKDSLFVKKELTVSDSPDGDFMAAQNNPPAMPVDCFVLFLYAKLSISD
jgi:hypothetical protein